MRISQIKSILGEGKIRLIVSKLWDIKEYRSALSKLPYETSDAIDICEAVIDGFLLRLQTVPNSDEITIKMIRTELNDIKRICKIAFEDKRYWSLNTRWENLSAASQYIADHLREAREKTIKQLVPLYETLQIERDQASDVIKRIVTHPEITKQLFDELHSIHSRQDIYNFCVRSIIPSMKEGTYRFRDFQIMRSASLLLYGDEEKWIAENGLPHEEFEKWLKAVQFKKRAKEVL